MSIDMTICKDGPILIKGAGTCTDGDSNASEAPAKNGTIALCRCGLSANKPFCDGSHRSGGFEGDGLTLTLDPA